MGAGQHTELIDRFGRVHRDLRISLTDRCNFRCTYCMPAEQMEWMPREELLTFEEIERVAAVLVSRCGVESIRLTGGEPLVRAHVPSLVRRLAKLPVELSMTTNGTQLPARAVELTEAGLQRINISLDSLDRELFAKLTGRDALDQVLAGIEAAQAAGLSPVKINCVVMAGVNDHEVVDLADFGRRQGVEMRFIEFMPLDGRGAWTGEQVISGTEIVARIAERWPVISPDVGESHDPAVRYSYADGFGSFGVISSVTRPFCGNCDRMRLTADGTIRNCLFATRELDIRGPLRDGCSDDDLIALIAAEIERKKAGHMIGAVQFIRPSRSMSQIGG